MTEWGPAEVARLARLARVEVADGEVDALAAQLARIAREFEGLRAHARALPEPEAGTAGELRDDVVHEAHAAEAILGQVPRLDASGKVRVERA